MNVPTAQRFCIVCGELFEGARSDELVCPRHAGAADVAAERGGVASGPELVPSEPGAFTASSVLARSVPPLVDFAIGQGEVVYALDSALGGQACSVAAWRDGEFISSSMLKVSEPLGIEVLDDGRAVVVGGDGTVVVLGGLTTADENHLPTTAGHQFHTHVTCVAKQPRADALAMGAPERDEVMRVDLPGFSQSAWAEGVPGRPVAVAFSGHGDQLAIGLDDSSLRVIDARSGAQRWTAQPFDFDGLGVVACTAGADGGWVVAYESQHVAAWDSTGHLSAVAESGFPISAAHADIGSGVVAVGGLHGEASVWSPDLRQLLVSGRPHDDPIVSILLLPGATRLVTGTEGGVVAVLELALGR